jgi:hypothetical protein
MFYIDELGLPIIVVGIRIECTALDADGRRGATEAELVTGIGPRKF